MAIRFYRTPLPLTWLYPDLLWKAATREKKIFLTFDDGPVPGPTDFVLGQLAAAGARGTFFCVGANVDRHPDLYRRILAAGHRTANHTYHHLSAAAHRDGDYLDDVQLCADTLARFGHHGQKPLFRPPHGRLRRSLIAALRPSYTIVMWSLLSYDFDSRHSPERSLRHLLRKTGPGTVVVFHDNPKHEAKMAYMLPRYLQHFRELGYRFSALPDMPLT
jgi:peptidoglycan-N-acetylglucosamine deacetylase